MRNLFLHGSSVSAALVTLAVFGCSGNYQPEGQFWPSDNGPLSAGGSSGIGQQGGSDPGNGGSADSAAGTPATFGGASTFGGAPTFGGGRSSGGAPTSNGGQSSGGGTSSGGAPSGGATSSSSCSLAVTVTTTAVGGEFRPKNIGAIWVATASGVFVKSLEVWAKQRISHLTAWNAATRAAGASANTVDAVTGPTLGAHRTHNVSWNCTDYKKAAVADGAYRVYFETTDSNNSGPNYFVAFTKGSAAATAQGSATNFQNVSLTFKP